MTLKAQFLMGAAFAAALLAGAPARADITIGLLAPLTGAVAAYGEQVKNGAQAAVDAINKKGGIGGEKVVLKLADDAGDPKQGVSAANLLVGDKVRFDFTVQWGGTPPWQITAFEVLDPETEIDFSNKTVADDHTGEGHDDHAGHDHP